MIDRKARNKAALAIRRYASGRITNDALDEAFIESKDSAISAICEVVWHYSLNRPKALRKDVLPKDIKRFFAGLVIFLKSEQEYAYPKGNYPFKTKWSEFFSAVTFGWSGRRQSVKKKLWCQSGDIHYWPFSSGSNLERAVFDFSFR